MTFLQRSLRLSLLAIVLSIATSLPAQQSQVDFVHEIVPILRTHCVTCHAGREAEGDFSMNTRSDVIQSGVIDTDEPQSSRLVELICSQDEDDQMPPSDRPRLEPREINLLKKWIGAGLPWNEDFTFAIDDYEPPLRPRTVELPEPQLGRVNPVDRILDGYLAQRQIPIPKQVDDATFLRRVSLDLIGLLPTPEELSQFLQDSSPDKRSDIVATLLERKIDYADHWLTFFNDLLRNDYGGTGFITGGRQQISEWLYEALLTNEPFDQLTRELIAPPTPASRGYIDGIKWRGTVSAGQTVEIQFSQNISQSFLGINMKCASCHDSFIDRWTLKEAYGLAAIYAESSPLQLYRCDKPTGEEQSAAWPFPELGQIDPGAPRDERLRQLSLLMTDPENGRFARTIVNRLWQRLLGRGIVHPLDAMQTEPWNADLLDYLANQLVEQNYDLKAILRLIATSEAYQSESEISDSGDSTKDYVYHGPRPRRMTAEQFMDSVWQLTGAAPTSYAAPVARVDLSQVDLSQFDIHGKWIWGSLTDNQSPAGETLLIRKVIVLPESVRSVGAIATCDNEFTMFVDNHEVAKGNNWSKLQSMALGDVLKKSEHTLIFRVKNGGAAGSMGPAGLFFELRLTLGDGSSRSIFSDDSWEFNRSVPAASKTPLDPPTEGWQKVSVVKPVAAWTQVLDREAPRALALAQMRAEQPPMVRAALLKNTPLMQSLGRPNRDQIVSSRPTGLTTLEALDLANETTLAEAFQRGGERWTKQPWASTGELVDAVFRSALSRAPTDEERSLFVEFLGEKPTPAALSDVLWSICMLPEFMLVR